MEQIISGDKAKMPMTERFYSVNGQMMGYESGGVKKDFLTDHLGSITAEIDQTQTRTYDTRYSAYGRNNWSTGTGCGFGWVGSYGYRETGLAHMSHYVRARHYSYVAGGWSTVDPLWPDESAYGYVKGRSTRSIDPTGRELSMTGCDKKTLVDPITKMCEMLNDKEQKGRVIDCIKSCNSDFNLDVRPDCVKKFCSIGSVVCGKCDPLPVDEPWPCPPGCKCKSLDAVTPCGHTPCKPGKPSNQIFICTNTAAANHKACGCSGSPPPNSQGCGGGNQRTFFHEMVHNCMPGCAFHNGPNPFDTIRLNDWAECFQKCMGFIK
jgi:RHS repeat-associated protein